MTIDTETYSRVFSWDDIADVIEVCVCVQAPIWFACMPLSDAEYRVDVHYANKHVLDNW